MEISYDKDADAMYIELSKAEFASNKVVDNFTILDLDKEGKIIGIELLSVSKRLPAESLARVDVKNLPVTA